MLASCAPAIPDQVTGAFDFQNDALAFNNFDDTQAGGEMTAALAARMFGDTAVCASGSGASCVPTAAANLWIEEVNATFHFGHSEGFAVMAQLFSSGALKAADFGASSGATLSRRNPAVLAELAYWAATQKVLAVHANDKKLGAKDALTFLATALKDSKERWRLLIAQRDENGFHAGHSVVPFGYFKGTEKGQYFIRIYDPNFPTEERRIEVNADANTWSYEGSPNPDAPRTYTGDSSNGNLLYFSPVTARQGTFTPPFVEGFAASSASAIIVESDDGAKVGFRNGQLFENGGIAQPAAADCFCKAPTGITNVLVSGTSAKTVTVGPDAGTLYATSPNVSAKVDATGGGAITVDPTAKTVDYNSTNDGGTTITTTTRNADGSQTTVTVTVDKSTAGITIDASDPNNVKVTTDVKTSSTNVFVTTTTTGADGGTQTTTVQGTTQNGNDAAFTINANTGDTTVNTNVNYATCKNGKKDPMETDVDCGAFCAAQDEHNFNGLCSIGQKCTADTECINEFDNNVGYPYLDGVGSCVNGKCAYTSCSDGKKNGFETTVDCGKRGWCACKEGGACTDRQDCATGLGCYQQTCRAAVLHPLTVIGLVAGTNVLVDWTEGSGALQTQNVFGVAGGGPVTFNGIATLQPTVINFYSDAYNCAFDTHDAQGQWVYDGTAATPVISNTLRCKLKRVKVFYNDGNTGCQNAKTWTFDGGITFEEWQLEGPLVHLSSMNAAVSAGDWNAATVALPVDFQVGTLDVAANYDGGTAWSVSIGGTVEKAPLLRGPVGTPAANAARASLSQLRYRMSCAATGATSGTISSANIVVPIACTCEVVDAGVPDAGVDAGSDAGFDAGFDAGLDAGFDAGVDAGTADAGSGPRCTLDSDCSSGADCYCGDSSGNCTGNSGHCGAGKYSTMTPTSDGVAPSGTFTVPTGCTTLKVDAWGAAGGPGQMATGFGPPVGMLGGSGGYVSGTLSVTAGDTVSVWVGAAGALAANAVTNEGVGSNLGTPTSGGLGDGMAMQSGGGSGGGLTSVAQVRSSSTIASFSVPGGGGGGSSAGGSPAGGSGSGTNTSNAGAAASFGSGSGGGGAGEKGGTAGSGGSAGQGGAFGTIPSGLTSTPGDFSGSPGGTSLNDFTSLCNASAGKATNLSGGPGCVVLRCLP